MTPAQAIVKLAELGLPVEKLGNALAILEAMEAGINAKDDARKEKDRLRKREERASKTVHECPRTEPESNGRDVDGVGQTSDVDDKKSFDKESFQTFKEITSKKLNTTRAKPVALPDDWEPNAKTWRLSEDLGFEPREVFDQIERMRDWAVNAPSSKSNKSDWDATFRNWLKRADDDRQKRKSGSIPKPNTFANGFDKIDAALGELERRERKASEDGGFLDIEAVPGLRQSAA